MTEAKEVQALAGTGTAVEFGSERLDVRPLRFGQLLDILAIAGPVVESLSAAAGPSADGFAAGADDIGFFVGLFSRHRKEVPQVLALAVGRDVDFIEAGELDQVLELFAAVYEVNRSFFDQSLAPALQKLSARWRGRSGNGDGPTPPSS